MEPIEYMRMTRELYSSLGHPPYGWCIADTPPAFTRLKKPLSESRIGLLATAGAYVVGSRAYHYKDDTSIRAIPKTTPTQNIHFAHITENYLPDPRRDPNCVFPIDALRTLEAEGFIGGLADDLFSCMGGVYSQRRVHAELIPALSEAFRKQNVDAVLLVPMCPVCHQTATLIARHLEAEGTPTMVMASALDIVKAGRAPRISFVDHPLGHTVGKPFNRVEQLDIVRRGLSGIETMTQAEQIAMLPYRWADTEDWKAEEWEKGGAGGKDERKPRDGTPQYQTEQDRILAEGR